MDYESVVVSLSILCAVFIEPPQSSSDAEQADFYARYLKESSPARRLLGASGRLHYELICLGVNVALALAFTSFVSFVRATHHSHSGTTIDQKQIDETNGHESIYGLFFWLLVTRYAATKLSRSCCASGRGGLCVLAAVTMLQAIVALSSGILFGQLWRTDAVLAPFLMFWPSLWFSALCLWSGQATAAAFFGSQPPPNAATPSGESCLVPLDEQATLSATGEQVQLL